MTDKTFDELMTQHEMGQAYVAITAAMGPSPQLLAFVNYENITEDSLGLESLDILGQHEQVLAEIAVDPSLSMACEALSDTLKKFAQDVKDAAPGVIDAVGKAAMSNVNENTPVYSRKAYNDITAHYDELLKFDLQLSSGIPGTFDSAAWKKYYDTVFGSPMYRFWHGATKQPRQLEAKYKVPFKDSGWSVSTYTDAVNWYNTNSDKIELLQKRYADKTQKVVTWIESANHTDKDVAKTLGFIQKTVGLSVRCFRDTEEGLLQVARVLDSVSKSFSEK